jgi:hypothetical protein
VSRRQEREEENVQRPLLIFGRHGNGTLLGTDQVDAHSDWALFLQSVERKQSGQKDTTFEWNISMCLYADGSPDL